jgi:hypothetical protein
MRWYLRQPCQPWFGCLARAEFCARSCYLSPFWYT